VHNVQIPKRTYWEGTLHLISGASNNRVHNLVAWGNSFGIALVNSDHTQVEGNATVAHNTDRCDPGESAAIALFGSAHNWIRDNKAELANFGIALVNSNDNWVENNKAAPENSDGNPCGGIALFDSNDNRVRDNRASQNRAGIFVAAGSSGNLVKDNLATFNGGDGINVDDSTTTLSKNTANNNGNLGIEAVAGVKDSGGNTAAGNYNPAQCVGVVCQ